ncbi:MAG: cytochrome c biogenesis protein ResB, partial [Actinomycetes bacterium]
MISKSWRRLITLLGSARFATVLLIVLGAWSVVGSLVPQGLPTNTDVIAWAKAHPDLSPYVRAVNLHQAFANPLFLALVVVLGVSTTLCAWERTKVAVRRAATLREASHADLASVVARHDLEIVCDPALSAPEALSGASETLQRLGIKTKSHGEALVAVSQRWTAWGSPIFHWALLGLLLALFVGTAFRAEGLMGVAVGQTRVDAPASYGVLHSGFLRNWKVVRRGIRVDAFEPNFVLSGVGRGPTPTVTVLDGGGKAIKTQRVYPNNTLKIGAVTIYPAGFGLAASASVVTTGGTTVGRGFQIVDFSQEASGGTVAVG